MHWTLIPFVFACWTLSPVVAVVFACVITRTLNPRPPRKRRLRDTNRTP